MAAIIAAVVFYSPAERLLNTRILDWRTASTELAPSNNVVFVAIDSRSLREVGTWPWPRSIHAEILDQLVDAGARDIFFDVDFAFASDAEGDAQFAAALDRAGGATYLATFAQPESVNQGVDLTYNRPISQFDELSWPAAVNVASDQDGLLRSYPSGTRIDDMFVPSAASLLAGGALVEDRQFEINYALSPVNIPSISAVDVARGNFPAETIEGRAIIVGASALELGDHFSVPLHQVIPGALVHALATETLLLDASISRGRVELIAVGLALLIFALNSIRRVNPWRLVSVTALSAFATEVAALILFQASFISAPTAIVHPALLAFILTTLSRSLDFSTFLLRRKNVEIRNTQALLNHLFEHSSDGFVIVDRHGQALMQSKSAERMFGTDDQHAVRVPPEIRRATNAVALEPALQSTSSIVQSASLLGEDGLRHIEYLATPSVFQHLDPKTGQMSAQQITAIAARDVTEVKRQEREIAYLSTHDERTGALRRRPFLEFLRLRLDLDEPTAVFVVNLQRFRTINLTLGRDVGDAVLAEVVTRLQSVDIGLSAIARLDGDSFACFVERVHGDGDVAVLAQTIWQKVCEPYVFSGVSAQIGARIGYFEVGAGDTHDPEHALSCAEDALDAARISKGSSICAYDPAVSKQRDRVRAVERAMPGAIERGELYVVYQPQHRLSDGALTGVEALVRWKNPSLGQVFPDEFIPIAESNGFINDLGGFVLRQAAEDARDLPQDVVMAVNVSSIQFEHGDLSEMVASVLTDTDLPAERLCLELTESVVLDQDHATIEMMQDIAWTGVTWALDDFGTGFSSMSYLSKLPLSKIKLDRSFTMDLDCNPTALSILRSVVTLCEGLGLCLLCEGVETKDHLNILREEGALEGQGYYFGRPQSLQDILSHIQSGEGPTLQTAS